MPDKSVTLDETDRALLGELTANARLPVVTLARRLGIARSTVQARIERLETGGVIEGYTVRLGAVVGAAQIRATALLQIEPRATPGVLGRLKGLPGVLRVHTTSGRFDLIVTLEAPTTEDLDVLLDGIIGAPGVRGSESLIHLSTRIDRAP